MDSFFKPYTTFKQEALEAKEASYDLMEYRDGEFTLEDINKWLSKYSDLDERIKEIAGKEKMYRQEEILFSKFPEIKRIYFLYRGITQLKIIYETEDLVYDALNEATNFTKEFKSEEEKNVVLDWIIRSKSLIRPIEITGSSDEFAGPGAVTIIFNEALEIPLNLDPEVFMLYRLFTKLFKHYAERLALDPFL